MTNIKINSKNNTLVITKAFQKEASNYGSDACKELIQAQKDFPNYTVVVKKASGKRESFNGLNYDFMKKYIEGHDNAEENLKMFDDLRGESDEAKETGIGAVSYGEIKAWFFKTYPEIEAFQKRREAALAA